jgi:multiple sugar transport system permease protein
MRHIIKTVLYIFLLLISLTMIFPFFWMILSAMKTKPEVEQMIFWPGAMRWHQFVEAWTAAPFNTFMWNSIWVTICSF